MKGGFAAGVSAWARAGIHDLAFKRLRRAYPVPAPRFELRAGNLGWTAAQGWPEALPPSAPDRDPAMFLFDLPEWLEAERAGIPTLELLAGRVLVSRKKVVRYIRRMDTQVQVPLIVAVALLTLMRNPGEWGKAAVETAAGLSLDDFITLTIPAAVEARTLGISVDEFRAYAQVTGGRIAPGALTAGVPAEYMVLL